MDYLERDIDWRDLFREDYPEYIEKAASLAEQRKVKKVKNYWYADSSYRVKDGGEIYEVYLYNVPRRYTDDWDKNSMDCNCKDYRSGRLCQHIADVLYAYETRHGLIHAKESDMERTVRIETDKIKAIQKAKKEAADASRTCPVSDFVIPAGSGDGLVFFDMENVLDGLLTKKYYIREAKKLTGGSGYPQKKFMTSIDRDGTKHISGTIDWGNEEIYGRTNIEMDAGRITLFSKGVYYRMPYSRYYVNPGMAPVDLGAVLNDYEIATLFYLNEYVSTLEEKDQTDSAAETFFKRLEESISIEKTADIGEQEPKKRNLLLQCRITIEDGEAKLGFKAGRANERLIVVKNLAAFAAAIRNEDSFELSKKVVIDFSKEDFREDMEDILSLLVQRVSEIDETNRQLKQNAYFGRSQRVRKLPVKADQDLKGTTLDRFYEASEDTLCEYTDKTNGIKDAMITVGYKPMSFTLHSSRLSDARGHFAGVAVSGIIPVMLKGATGRYILNSSMLSRITPEEQKTLKPFSSVADPSGYFRFQVGRDRLQEFYYRVLPALLESPSVNFIDECGDEAAEYLPPEPSFVFYFDHVGERLTVRCEVSYDDKTYPITSSGAGYRDVDQEKRVRAVLERYCPKYDPEERVLYGEPDEDGLYEFLSSGIDLISHYGEVKGTEAFKKLHLSPTPQVRVGISVDSGILDLSVTSKDVSEDELLDVLESYRLKKKYYRLKSGEFINLSADNNLGELRELFAGMELLPMDVIKKKAHLPLYRALYLDRLLSEHDSVVTSRDRTYRALIRNFNEVRDSDYEVPEAMSDIVRPYQSYGHKWLRTVENAGFGGILADEMGLGKTLELISVLYAAYEEGNRKPSLIVVPASVVYNWQEEVRRFAPKLPNQVIVGTQSERKKLIGHISEDSEGTVYITSYDLLKRDIAWYEDKRFYICALDEAQTIKNPKAAVTKAVKVIKSEHRFALTGTPIENRLSELWSIFDFLMPGFLYTSDYFVKNFERAITKEKDPEVTAKLKKLVSPFILRRKKEDVLKDLPEKLEEVSYARLEGEQQKIYDGQVVRMKRLLASTGNTGEDRIKILAELTRTRQICCDPSLVVEDYSGESAKRQALLELIERAMDGGHRMLVFSQFVTMIELIKEDLDEKGIPYFVITGATPKEKRLALVRDFNNGDTPVFLISLKAGGVGLNLTGADVVIHYDPWWNLAVQNQATDRAHRIGQKKQVTVYKMIAKDTIEERIMELQNAKRDLAEAILEGRSESLMSLSNEELLELFS